MGQRKNQNRLENEQEHFETIVASVLALVAEDEARRRLSLAVKHLMNALQSKPSKSSVEDEWLIEVEHLATQVREDCNKFQEDGTIVREELYSLLQSLEDGNALSAPKNVSLDSTRVILVCRSLMASYRLQAQMDEQVVDEILLFLSTLYSDIDSGKNDSGESNGGGLEGRNSIVRMYQRIEELESQIFLNSTWHEALQELESLCSSEDTTMKHHYNDKDRFHGLDHHEKLLSVDEDSNALVNPLASSASVMDAVVCFLDTPEKGARSLPLSFLLLVGPQGSGKSFMCDKIEKKVERHEGDIQGMVTLR